LCIFLANIISRDIGFNGVSSDVLIAASNVQSQIWQYKMLVEDSFVRKTGVATKP
jgi:hypothetical protein